MLLEFGISNYKCFQEEVVLKMTPAPKLQDLSYSVIKLDNGIKALSSAVIYGPNASGKTNLIGAMETFKSIVKRGHIRNEDKKNDNNNIAKDKLELIPNYKSNAKTPVCFRIMFVCCGLKIEYSLDLHLGQFLEVNAKRKVARECLNINDKMIFYREEDLKIGKIEVISNYLINGFKREISDDLAKKNLNDEELFLNTIFKTMYSNKITNSIIEWFDTKLVIIFSADRLTTGPAFDNSDDKEKALVDEYLNKASKEFGLTADMVVYKHSDQPDTTELMSIIRKDDTQYGLNSEIFESYGTLRFMNLFPIIREVLYEGQILFVDEFDASIHPMALISIINIFHNDDINVNGAQLIFNTHNPIFLNRNIFRRDEIKFVEKDEETEIFTHYSLSDFGTSGNGAVRNTENYLNNYFVSKYGAIKEIDFLPIFEKIMQEEGEKDEAK